jgi:hypothetical protein
MSVDIKNPLDLKSHLARTFGMADGRDWTEITTVFRSGLSKNNKKVADAAKINNDNSLVMGFLPILNGNLTLLTVTQEGI